jgi:hypothetical protein
MDRNPNRHWIRYRLRTLLIAFAVLSVWVAWNASIVRERKSVAYLIRQHRGQVLPWADEAYSVTHGGSPPRVSLMRRLLGDDTIAQIYVYERLPLELNGRMRSAFPEATISEYTSAGQ